MTDQTEIEEQIQQIALMDADLNAWAEKVNADAMLRDAVIFQMLHHPHIMVYYHCYEVVSIASRQQPELYIRDWDDVAGLLHHPNSYHRNFGLTILANLVCMDKDHRFDLILPEYLSHLNDKKFLTSIYCLQDLGRILQVRKDLAPQVLPILLALKDGVEYKPKQKALMMSDIVDIIETNFLTVEYLEQVKPFIKEQLESISPKTRNKAKQLMRRIQS